MADESVLPARLLARDRMSLPTLAFFMIRPQLD